MQVGLMAPQGWKGEYDGWGPADAWARTIEHARQADELGFEALWVFDHFHTVPEPTDEITFESFSVLTALANPATLRFSLYTKDEEMREAGQARVDTLAEFAEVGLDRIVCFPTRWSPTTEAQATFAEDCRAAGLTLG